MKATIGILLALLLCSNVWQFLDRKKLQQELSQVGEKIALQVEATAAPLREEAESLQRENRALSKKLATAEAEAEAAESKQAAGDGIGKNPMKAMSKAMENPGMREMMAAQQRATLDAVYSRLYEQLALEGDELEHFQRLITDAQMTVFENGMKMLSGDLSQEERQELIEGMAAAQVDLKARVREFLNDDEDFDYYNFYTETFGERMAMNGLRSVLEPAGNALNAETEEALVQLMYDEREAIGFEEHYYDQNRFDPSTITQTKIDRFLEQYDELQSNLDSRAATVLSGAQLEAFQANQKTSRAMQEMGLGMMLNMFGKESP